MKSIFRIFGEIKSFFIYHFITLDKILSANFKCKFFMIRFVFLFSSIFFIHFVVLCQSYSQQLGGLPTDFLFSSGSKKLDIRSQFLIKSAGYHLDYNLNSEVSYELGGGYESLHLEFMTNTQLEQDLIRRTNYTHRLEFYDVNDILLTRVYFIGSRAAVHANLNNHTSPTFYSFDLVTIPVSILDFTHRINVIEIKSSREEMNLR
jgi:hypothetical protein